MERKILMPEFADAILNISQVNDLESPIGRQILRFNEMFFSQKKDGLLGKNVFDFEETRCELSSLKPTDFKNMYIDESGEIVIVTDYGKFTMVVRKEETSFTIKDNYVSEKNVFHAVDPEGKEVCLRIGFLSAEDAAKELEAINELAKAGCPVPKNAKLDQFIFPWQDALVYDWIEGENLLDVINSYYVKGDVTALQLVLSQFGESIRLYWEGVLSGRTSFEGGYFVMPDDALGNFIFNEKTGMFTRIDILGLSKAGPLTMDKFAKLVQISIMALDCSAEVKNLLFLSFKNGIGN